MDNDWDSPDSPFLTKCRAKVISPNTVKRMSCENLRKRVTCIGGKTVTTISSDGKEIQSLIFDPRETQIPNTLAYTFDQVLTEMNQRVCPPVSPTKLKQVIESEFPNHRVKRWRNTIQLPSTFSTEELTQLELKLPKLSQKWYNMRYNERLDRHYISPKSKNELQKEMNE